MDRTSQRRAGRLQALDRLCARLEELKLLVQIGEEAQAFLSFQEFVQAIEQVVSVAKQAEAYRLGPKYAVRLVRLAFAWR